MREARADEKRGGASATIGSTNPGGKSVSAFGRGRAAVARNERGRLRPARGEGAQAGREERAAARNRGAPQRLDRYIFPGRRSVGVRCAQPTESLGSPRPSAESRGLGRIRGAATTTPRMALGGTRGEGARRSRAIERQAAANWVGGICSAGCRPESICEGLADIRGVAKQKKPTTYRTHSVFSAWLLFGHRKSVGLMLLGLHPAQHRARNITPAIPAKVIICTPHGRSPTGIKWREGEHLHAEW